MFNYKELLSNMISSFDDMSDVVVNPIQANIARSSTLQTDDRNRCLLTPPNSLNITRYAPLIVIQPTL